MNLQTLVIVIVVLATAGLASFLRALPWPKPWLEVKPLGCPACMSGWAGIFVLGFMLATGDLIWSHHICVLWLASMPASMWLFKQLYPPEVDLPLP